MGCVLGLFGAGWGFELKLTPALMNCLFEHCRTLLLRRNTVTDSVADFDFLFFQKKWSTKWASQLLLGQA